MRISIITSDVWMQRLSQWRKVMNILKTAIVASVLLMPLSAYATVESDINNNAPMKLIFDNAFADELDLVNIFDQIAAADQSLTPDATTYATCNKLDTNETIVSMAFLAAPELAEPIANAARACGVTEEELLNSALASNIDPTTIGEATAAGGGLPGAGGAGGTGAPLSAPTFGSAGGAGGGGTASDA